MGVGMGMRASLPAGKPEVAIGCPPGSRPRPAGASCGQKNPLQNVFFRGAKELPTQPAAAGPPQAAYTIAAECGLLPITLTIAAQVVRSWGEGWGK